ncbi:MAG: hypothetical protein SH850_00775 [Planctomycetaceae bacterium]|nr:hypothetical protein [Planctomycetaceae bacterium]
MLQAYVGIVSRQGLEVFCPEHPQTVRFLQRRVERTRGQAVCFWSVVPDDAADQVRTALRCGERQLALHLLQQATRDGGSLLPTPDDAVDTWVMRSDA